MGGRGSSSGMSGGGGGGNIQNFPELKNRSDGLMT